MTLRRSLTDHLAKVDCFFVEFQILILHCNDLRATAHVNQKSGAYRHVRLEAGLLFGLGGSERIRSWVRERARALRACVALGAAASLITTPAWAGPQGGQVVGGQAIIQTLSQETLIKQSTKKSIINW